MIELFIIRHAKSSWEDDNLSDFDRPLNERGERDASLIGSSIKENQIIPDLIISSPANRAISTAKIIAKKIGYNTDKIQIVKATYEASSHSLLKIVNQIDDKYKRTFMFGHNPGFTDLVEKLSGEYIGNLPTCGVVGIQFEFESWEMIMQNSGTRIYLDYPKRYK